MTAGGYRRAFLLGFGGFLGNATVGLASAIVTARLYGVEVIGEFALVSAPTAALWYLSTVGEQPALSRMLATLAPRAPRVTGLVLSTFLLSSALTLAGGALVLGVAYLLLNGPVDQPGLFAPAAVGVAGYFVFTNPSWNLDGLLSAFTAASALFWVRLHQTLAYLGFAIFASTVSKSVWALTLATIASWATSLVHRTIAVRPWMRWRVPRHEIRDGLRELPGIVRFGLKLVPGTLSYGGSTEAGTWIVGSFLPVQTLGAYNRAWTLAQRLLDLNYRITEILLPTVVRRRSEGAIEGSERALIDSLRISAMLLLLPAGAVGGAAVGVMAFFGAGFEKAADALWILLLLPVCATLAQQQIYFFIAMGKPFTTTVYSVIRLVVTISATIAFTSWFGVTGAAAGLVTGVVFQLILQTLAVSKLLERPLTSLWPPRQMAVMALAYGTGLVVARLCDASSHSFALTLVAILAGTLAYGGTIAVGGLLPRDRARLRSVTRGVRGRARAVLSGSSS